MNTLTPVSKKSGAVQLHDTLDDVAGAITTFPGQAGESAGPCGQARQSLLAKESLPEGVRPSWEREAVP